MPNGLRFDRFIPGFDHFIEVATPKVIDGQYLRSWPERMLVQADHGFLRPEPTSEHHKLFLGSIHSDPGHLERPIYFFEVADCARSTNCFEIEPSCSVFEYELACFNSYNAVMEVDFESLSGFFDSIGVDIEYRGLPGSQVELDMEMVDRRTGVVFGHWEIARFLNHIHSELQLRMTTIRHWERKRHA